MTQLVALLADDDAIGQAPDLTLVEELVARAAGTGLDVTLRLEGSREGLPASAVQTVYRVVRESLTNALRYASGAPVHVLVRGGAGGDRRRGGQRRRRATPRRWPGTGPATACAACASAWGRAAGAWRPGRARAAAGAWRRGSPAPWPSRWTTEADGYGTSMARGLLAAAIAADRRRPGGVRAPARAPAPSATCRPRRSARRRRPDRACCASRRPSPTAPGASNDPRGRPVRRGRAALRPHRGVAGRARRLRRRAPGRAHRRRRRAGHRPGRPRLRARLRERSRAGLRGGHRALAGRVGEHRPGRRASSAWATTPARAGSPIAQPTAADTPVAYVADQYNHRIQVFRLDQDATGDPGHPVLPAGGDRATSSTCPRRRRSGACTATARRERARTRSTTTASTTRRGSPSTPAAATSSSPTTTTIASSSSSPTAPTCARSAPTASARASSASPTTSAIDAREPRQLYVADNNNHRVQAFDFATLAFQRTWGQFGTEVGDFGFTRALAAVADDPVGGVAVADTANDRVQTYAPDGAPTAAWGIAGRGPGYVTRPEGVAVDAAGDVHVADTLDHRVERLGPDGAYLGQTRLHLGQLRLAAPNTGNGQFDTPAASPSTGRPDACGWPTRPTPACRRSVSTGPGRRPPRGSARRASSRSRPTARSTSPTPATAASSAAIPSSGAWTTLAAGLSSPAGVAGHERRGVRRRHRRQPDRAHRRRPADARSPRRPAA